MSKITTEERVEWLIENYLRWSEWLDNISYTQSHVYFKKLSGEIGSAGVSRIDLEESVLYQLVREAQRRIRVQKRDPFWPQSSEGV